MSFEIASYLGSIYLSKYPDLAEISEYWLDSGIPYQQIAYSDSYSPPSYNK